LVVIANVGGLVISPFLLGVLVTKLGWAGVVLVGIVFNKQCLSLAPVPLDSVVKPVVSGALFCYLSLLGGGNLRVKNSSLSV